MSEEVSEERAPEEPVEREKAAEGRSFFLGRFFKMFSEWRAGVDGEAVWALPREACSLFALSTPQRALLSLPEQVFPSGCWFFSLKGTCTRLFLGDFLTVCFPLVWVCSSLKWTVAFHKDDLIFDVTWMCYKGRAFVFPP